MSAVNNHIVVLFFGANSENCSQRKSALSKGQTSELVGIFGRMCQEQVPSPDFIASSVYRLPEAKKIAEFYKAAGQEIIKVAPHLSTAPAISIAEPWTSGQNILVISSHPFFAEKIEDSGYKTDKKSVSVLDRSLSIIKHFNIA